MLTYLTEGIDFYKFTMGQVLLKHEPDAIVQYTFKDRSGTLMVDPHMQSRLESIRRQGFTQRELYYLHQQGISGAYVDYLATNELPHVEVDGNHVCVEGPAALATLWETIILSEINESYYEMTPELFYEGIGRLMAKVKILSYASDIAFSDFGTRRRFSKEWQYMALMILKNSLPPETFVGTSNVGFAMELDLTPIGSFAHEMPMIWAACADIRGQDILASHQKFLDIWLEQYGPRSLALTDTWGTDFFFKTFKNPDSWRGLRQDSGNPFEFGERAIRYYVARGIDPATKTLLFSDGLDLHTILDLYSRFTGRVNLRFGWGTTLMNDLGVPATNIVMKATRVTLDGQTAETVKLSDTPGKYSGSQEKIAQYLELLSNVR